MRPRTMSFRTLASCAFAIGTVSANIIVDGLSFGHKNEISKDGRTVPGWLLSSAGGYTPEIFSDRIILTPPYPGNKRSAMWAINPEDLNEWTAELDFRVSSPERGGGNLQIWFTADGEGGIGHNSLYTVGKFDGLVLVVDQHGGKGGSIRGFLNDGAVSYKDHHNVDSLAFGHCDYAYRNTGRFLPLQMKQTSSGFEVSVDGRECFRSNKIRMPTGYHFGISAASAENADSFEVQKFTVSSPDAPGQSKQTHETHQQEHHEAHAEHGQDWDWEYYPDNSPTEFKSQDTQFADLHNRLMTMNHQVNNIFRDQGKQRGLADGRHSEITNKLNPLLDRVNNLERTLSKIEHVVVAIQKDLEGKDYADHLEELHHTLQESHMNLMTYTGHLVTEHKPQMWFFILSVLAFQGMLAISYVIYRRRKDNVPKKYL